MQRVTGILMIGALVGVGAILLASPQVSTDPASLQKQLTDLQRFVHDWPNVGRYRAENATVPPPSPDEKRVVFIGDSIVDRWRALPNSFLRQPPYIGRGIGGQTTPQMLVRFRPDVISLSPKVVVIMGGTNDLASKTGPETLGDIEGNLASMAQLAKVNNIQVVMGSLLPVCGNYVSSHPPAQIVELNRWVRTFCLQQHLTFLDYHTSMMDGTGELRRELTDDCIHPNEAGYALMKPLALSSIAEALRQTR